MLSSSRGFKWLVPAIALACAIICGTAARAEGPSFDCRKASLPAEKAICADPQLSAIDALVAKAFTGFEPAFGGDKRGISPELLAILADPGDKGPVELLTDGQGNEWLINRRNGFKYPVEDGIPIMLLEEGEKHKDDGLIAR